MAAPTCTEEEFVRIWGECGNVPSVVARRLGISVRNVQARRKRLEMNRGIYLQTIATNAGAQTNAAKAGVAVEAHAYTPLACRIVKNCYVVVFSDAHFWPGQRSVAHEALCKLLPEIKPKLVIGNGDLFDGATISRHDVLGWQKLPTVAEELDACRLRLSEIKRAARSAETLATVGNHDSRMDRRLATQDPQFKDVHGMRLQDHLRDWPMSYAILLNEDIDPVFIVHNIKNGIHATWNNTASAGCHVITGHLHDQNERTRSFLLRESIGIDAGCLADVDSAAFSYRMGRPANWRSGFVVLQFDSVGRLYPVEFCRVQVFKDVRRAIFRGRILLERREARAA